MNSAKDESNSNSNSNSNSTTLLEKVCQETVAPLTRLQTKIAESGVDIRPITFKVVLLGHIGDGKTSLLEGITGIRLPVAKGLRAPLILNFVGKMKTDEEHAWVVTGPQRNRTERIELGEIPAKVAEYSKRGVAGAAKGLHSPLVLDICRETNLNMTFVDMAGYPRSGVDYGRDYAVVEEEYAEMFGMELCMGAPVLINVASTSYDRVECPSLGLCKDLDCSAEKTLLCCTKLDKLVERGGTIDLEGLVKQVSFKSKNSFVISNRSRSRKGSGCSKDSIAQVRQAEDKLIRSTKGLVALGKRSGVGLGVRALCQRLGDLFLSHFNAEFPQFVATEVKEQLSELDDVWEVLRGDPEARKRTDYLLNELQYKLAKVTFPAMLMKDGFAPEEHHRVIRVESLAKLEPGAEVVSEKIQVLDDYVEFRFYFDLERVDPKDKNSPKVGRVSVYMFVFCHIVKEVKISGSVKVDNDSCCCNWQFSDTLEAEDGSECMSFMTDKDIKALLSQPVKISCSLTVESMKFAHKSMWAIETGFKSAVEGLYPDKFFFSDNMFAKMKAHCRARGEKKKGDGCPPIPVATVHKLQEKLGPEIQRFASEVESLTDCMIRETLFATIRGDECDGLHDLVQYLADRKIEQQGKITKDFCTYLLRWERDHVHTSCDCYMTRVQSIREYLDGKSSSDRPKCLPSSLTPAKLKRMPKADQEVWNTIIYLFAYWGAMRSRLVERVQDSVRTNALTDALKVFGAELTPALFRTRTVVSLMRPMHETVIRRKVLRSKISNLQQGLETFNSIRSARTS